MAAHHLGQEGDSGQARAKGYMRKLAHLWHRWCPNLRRLAVVAGWLAQRLRPLFIIWSPLGQTTAATSRSSPRVRSSKVTSAYLSRRTSASSSPVVMATSSSLWISSSSLTERQHRMGILRRAPSLMAGAGGAWMVEVGVVAGAVATLAAKWKRKGEASGDDRVSLHHLYIFFFYPFFSAQSMRWTWHAWGGVIDAYLNGFNVVA